MKIYNVILHTRNDCYKRASTWTDTVLTTTDKESAYNAAANAWLENYTERFDEDYAPELQTIQSVIEEHGDGESIHEVFDLNKWEIYNPEFINQPTFEVSVEAESLNSELCALNNILVREIVEFPIEE